MLPGDSQVMSFCTDDTAQIGVLQRAQIFVLSSCEDKHEQVRCLSFLHTWEGTMNTKFDSKLTARSLTITMIAVALLVLGRGLVRSRIGPRRLLVFQS